MSTSDDSPSGSPSKGSPNHQNDGFIEILTAQEALFTQTESILLNLTDRAPGPDGMVSLDPKNLQALKDIVLNLKDFFLLFQKRSIDDITHLETALKESKAREMEWKELADLFTQYRTKVTGEMMNMKHVIDSYGSVKEEMQDVLREKESQIALLQDQLVGCQDLLLRVQATGKRRANIMALEADIGEEELAIMKSISRLRAAAIAVNKEE